MHVQLLSTGETKKLEKRLEGSDCERCELARHSQV